MPVPIYFDGVNTGTSAKTVVSGAILGGAGTIVGTLTVNAGGIIKPGASGSTGTLTNTGNVTFNGASKLVLNVVNATKDVLNLSGNLVVDATTTIELESGYSYSEDVTVVLISGTTTNAFADTNLPFAWSSIFTANTDVVLTFDLTLLPTLNEWGMIILIISIAVSGILLMRKRRSANFA